MAASGGGFTITQLPSGNPVQDTDAFVIARGNTNYQVVVPLQTIQAEIAAIQNTLPLKADLVGGVVPDGELPLISAARLGIARVDGTTIAADANGIISVQAGAGVVFATQAEVDAGVSTTTVVSPNTLVNSKKANLVNSPIAGDLLTTDASGQPQDSGVSITADQTFAAASDLQVPTALAVKTYVQNSVQGLDVKDPVLVATVGAVPLTGLQTIDGVALAVGDRVLVKNQALSQFNGIYVVSAGAWTRSVDANTWNELVQAYTFVQSGAVNANSGWICNVATGGTLDVTPLPWSQFSAAGSYTAGTGLTLTGTQFSVAATGVTLGSYGDAANVPTYTVNAQGQLTVAANVAIAIDAAQTVSGVFTPDRLPETGVTKAQATVSANTTLGAADFTNILGADNVTITLPAIASVAQGDIFYFQVGNYTGVQIAPNAADSIFPAAVGIGRYLAPNSTYQYRCDGAQWVWIG